MNVSFGSLINMLAFVTFLCCACLECFWYIPLSRLLGVLSPPCLHPALLPYLHCLGLGFPSPLLPIRCHPNMFPRPSSTPKHPIFNQRVLLITPRSGLSITAMLELATTKSNAANLGDSSSTPTPTSSPSKVVFVDIGGSQTIVDASEIGEDTNVIPIVHEVPLK